MAPSRTFGPFPLAAAPRASRSITPPASPGARDPLRDRARPSAGQALVETALALPVFLLLLLGIVDLGRGIYVYNGVSQAAREIARVASVHPGTDPTSSTGWSQEIHDVIAVQQRLVPDLGQPAISCVDLAGQPVDRGCRSGDWVRVHVEAPFAAAAPLLAQISWPSLGSTATVALQ